MTPLFKAGAGSLLFILGTAAWATHMPAPSWTIVAFAVYVLADAAKGE